MEESLWWAARDGDDRKMSKILQEDPGVSVNWKNESGRTPLHVACVYGRNKIATLLLAHPRIDVNLKDKGGATPFLLACDRGSTSCVRLLLKDSRTRVHEPDKDGRAPLRHAAYPGHLDSIRWWIASGREMDLGEPGNENNDVIGAIRGRHKIEVTALLKRIKDHPEETRHQVRVELGWYVEMAAEVFALVVFASDGLLEIKENENHEAARFLRIIVQLPLELQMILCHRVVGSFGMNITGNDAEAAFRDLAKKLRR